MRARLQSHARIAALSLLSLMCSRFHPRVRSRTSTRARPIRLIVGQAAGGGYDTYGRLLAPFLTQFLPGQPAVTVQNMPGAGSILMANYLYARRRATAPSSRSAAAASRPRPCSALPARVSIPGGSAGSAA